MNQLSGVETNVHGTCPDNFYSKKMELSSCLFWNTCPKNIGIYVEYSEHKFRGAEVQKYNAIF